MGLVHRKQPSRREGLCLRGTGVRGVAPAHPQGLSRFGSLLVNDTPVTAARSAELGRASHACAERRDRKRAPWCARSAGSHEFRDGLLHLIEEGYDRIQACELEEKGDVAATARQRDATAHVLEVQKEAHQHANGT